MRKTLLAAITAILTMFGLGGAFSASAEPGPNGHNNHGLCTAYFNGQKNGHTEGAGPGPFGALEQTAATYDETHGENSEEDDELQASDDVFEYCNQYGISGNPEENGRFDCRDGEENTSPPRDTDTDQEIECVANGTEPAPA